MTDPTGTAPTAEETAPARRLDAIALVFGVLCTTAALVLLTGGTLRLDPAWMVPAGLAAAGLWLVSSAVRGRSGAADG